ncbi:hypothetical protein Afil01_02330 [Actinorhabdospora filicis]|uniref:Uncharacterized protein n=1 Tax=Actinorhabdospora filicis TaxID=1785913 RepID=A0A9W6W7F2_9ACTN|nr:hypothetical protein [Actinorhabdospora filicis]GLZ75426.1 hypothetical protein Afil01_02330 [Actinorhabdospora filicis]
MTSAVTELFRAAVHGDAEGIDRATSSLDADGWAGAVRPILAVFGMAVQRRFPPDHHRADVIHFVADHRAAGHYDVSADLAERLILVALGQAEIDPDLGFEEVVTPQIAMAVKILRDEKLSEAELDAFLTEADARVAAWLAAED